MKSSARRPQFNCGYIRARTVHSISIYIIFTHILIFWHCKIRSQRCDWKCVRSREWLMIAIPGVCVWVCNKHLICCLLVSIERAVKTTRVQILFFFIIIIFISTNDSSQKVRCVSLFCGCCSRATHFVVVVVERNAASACKNWTHCHHEPPNIECQSRN